MGEKQAYADAKRVRLAGALDRMGLLQVILEARSRSLLPWRWLTVLTFHRVGWPGSAGFDPEVIDTNPEQFERQLEILKQYFTIIDTRDLEAHRAGRPLPQNPALVTFDDGYRDNHDQALPILKRQGVKAVFFIATRFVEERRVFWWERINDALARCQRSLLELAYPEPLVFDVRDAEGKRAATKALLKLVKTRAGLDLDRFLSELCAACGTTWTRDEERRACEELIMSWDHVRALADAGMDVQSHTHSHRIVQTLTPDEVTADLATSRQLLEAKISQPVHAVAYPAGKPIVHRAEMRAAVLKSGMRLGFTSGFRNARLDDGRLDWLDLPRVAMDLEMPEPFFRGCLAIPALSF